MSKRVFWPLAVAILFCVVLPIRGQGQGGAQGGGVVRGDDAPVARVAGEVEKLPAGPGKDIVGAACAQCHALQQLDRGHDAGQWQLTVERMLAAGAKVPPAQVDTVVAYLAKNFPEKPLPPAVIVPGNANVVFREWTAPTKGSRPLCNSSTEINDLRARSWILERCRAFARLHRRRIRSVSGSTPMEERRSGVASRGHVSRPFDRRAPRLWRPSPPDHRPALLDGPPAQPIDSTGLSSLP